MRCRSAIHATGVALVTLAACASFGTDETSSPDAGVDAIAPPPPEAGLDASDLVASWPFDDGMGTTARDAISTNTGTLDGPAHWTSGRDGGGSALALDGVTATDGTGDGGLVRVHDAIGLRDVIAANAFTLAVWVKLGAVDYDQRVFSWPGSFYLKLSNRRPQLAFDGTTYWESGIDYPPDEWHHFAVTYAAGVVAMYRDGKPDSSLDAGAKGLTLATPAGDVFIGAGDADHYFAKGAFAEMTFWKRALGAGEIATLATR